MFVKYLVLRIMSGSDIPNGSSGSIETDEYSQLSAELEKLDGALAKLEENSNSFTENATSLLLELRQLKEESKVEQAQASPPEDASSEQK